MRHLRLCVLLVVLSLLAAACSTDDDAAADMTEVPAPTDPPTTATEAPTTTEGGPPATWDAAFFEEKKFQPLNSCYYAPDILWIAEGREADAILELAARGVIAVEDVFDGEESFVPSFEAHIDVITLDQGSPDPAIVAGFLLSENIQASPVHAVGMAGHWQFKPGTEPMATDAENLFAATANVGSDFIAVVDTGIDDNEGFLWMFDTTKGPSGGDSVVFDMSGDTHELGASHGTFIASLIRQMAPSYRVSFASTPAVPKASFLSWPSGGLGPDVTDLITSEFEVLEGVQLIINRHTTDDDYRNSTVVALNLSFGTYPCIYDSGPAVLGMQAVLDSWSQEFPGAPIFAAAGNEQGLGPFYPAAFTDVTGVAAEVVWDDGTAAADLPVRAWTSVVAPGCDLVGVSPGSLDDFVVWSGSSFATAVATAAWAESGMAKDMADQAVTSNTPVPSDSSLSSCQLP